MKEEIVQHFEKKNLFHCNLIFEQANCIVECKDKFEFKLVEFIFLKKVSMQG